MAKFKRVAARRQPDLTVILENVHDPHNVSAVLRSCDSVGIREIFVLYTDPGLDEDRLELGKRSSAGARKWVDVHFYADADVCFRRVRQRYSRILSTHLDEEAVPLYDLDLTTPVALLFGNERDGVSEEALAYSDGNFTIPQVGMSASLNISVACAVTLYEAFRQRWLQGRYTDQLPMDATQQEAQFRDYLRRDDRKTTRRIDP
jgi:tRNA (guanosine-2'-O-)-methyltransferase